MTDTAKIKSNKVSNLDFKKVSRFQILAAFSKQTSISGLSNAGAAKSYFRATCWFLLFACFVAFTVIGFRGVVNDFLSYPVTTSIYIEHHYQVIYNEIES